MINTIQSRILLKADFTANWETISTSFIPQKGEACVYLDKDSITNETGETISVPGIKIGDGTRSLDELEFITEELNLAIKAVEEKIIDSESIEEMIKSYVDEAILGGTW